MIVPYPCECLFCTASGLLVSILKVRRHISDPIVRSQILIFFGGRVPLESVRMFLSHPKFT